MRTSPKPFFYIILAIVAIHIIIIAQYRHAVKELDDWGENTTRNIAHYIDLEIKNVPTSFCQYPTTLLIMVHSKPSSISARRAIRATWGNRTILQTHNTSLFFLVGQSPLWSQQLSLELENTLSSDIIMEKFPDTSSMQTLKSLSMLKLFNFGLNCKYLLKVDTTVFVNLQALVAMLKKRDGKDLLMGRLLVRGRRKNDYYKRWYAPRYMYLRHQYPRFLEGPSYLMSQDVGRKLYSLALEVPLFHLEDVFVTGILAEEAGINRTHSREFMEFRMSEFDCFLLRLYTASSFSDVELRELHKLVGTLENRCSRRRIILRKGLRRLT